jgi:hypothetical protein
MGCNLHHDSQSEHQNSHEGWLWKNISCQHALKNKTGSLGLSPAGILVAQIVSPLYKICDCSKIRVMTNYPDYGKKTKEELWSIYLGCMFICKGSFRPTQNFVKTQKFSNL